MTLLDRAESLARSAHKGQERRDGSPYIEHPERVAARCKRLGLSEQHQAAAWLHDAVEDGMDSKRLDVFPGQVREMVLHLTKKDGEAYEQYIEDLPDEVIPVKVADIVDNLTDGPTEAQQEKYLRALAFLATGEWPVSGTA